MTDIRIRPYVEDDEAETLEVLRAALGVTEALPQSPVAWRWKHRSNPFGESPILLATLEGRIVGVRAYLRWRFTTPEGGSLSALRAVDTATHPDHLRKGVFRALTLEANRKAEADGVDLIFNTPNASSLPGYLSMGWKAVGVPRLWFRPMHPTGLIRRRESEEGIPDPGRMLPGGAPLDPSPTRDDRPPLGLRTPRPAEYLQWRFADHPTVPYRAKRTEAALAIGRPNARNGRKELVISELLGEGPELRGALAGLTAGTEASYAVVSARWDSPEASVLRRSGYLMVPKVGLTLVANPFSPAAKAALKLAAWDLSLGDLELM